MQLGAHTRVNTPAGTIKLATTKTSAEIPRCKGSDSGLIEVEKIPPIKVHTNIAVIKLMIVFISVNYEVKNKFSPFPAGAAANILVGCYENLTANVRKICIPIKYLYFWSMISMEQFNIMRISAFFRRYTHYVTLFWDWTAKSFKGEGQAKTAELEKRLNEKISKAFLLSCNYRPTYFP